MFEQGVDHYVADEMNFLRRDAFFLQIFIGNPVGGKQIITDGIGTQTIDFLRHRHIARTQTSLDLGYGVMAFFRRQRTGQG